MVVKSVCTEAAGPVAEARGRVRKLAEARGRVRKLAEARGHVRKLAEARSVRKLAEARGRVRKLAEARGRVRKLAEARGRVRKLAEARSVRRLSGRWRRRAGSYRVGGGIGWILGLVRADFSHDFWTIRNQCAPSQLLFLLPTAVGTVLPLCKGERCFNESWRPDSRRPEESAGF